MCICCILRIMSIRIRRWRMGNTVVDSRRGCDGVEELSYGCTLMGMRVVQWPIHRCCDEGGLVRQGEMARGKKGTRTEREGEGGKGTSLSLNYMLGSAPLM